MRERDMKMISAFFRDALIDNVNLEKIKKDVIEYRKAFQQIKYCFKA